MSIDKTIEFFNGLECHTPQAKDARDTAIDTMRKYKYIQEIYKSWRTGDYKGSTECMEEIGEVLEDGNVD